MSRKNQTDRRLRYRLLRFASPLLLLRLKTKTTTTTTKSVSIIDYIPKSSFNRFGDDMAEQLLTYLPIDDKLRLQSVCRQWRSLIFVSQTRLVFDERLMDRLNGKYRRINSSPDEKTDDNYANEQKTINWFAIIIKKCPNLSSVTINVDLMSASVPAIHPIGLMTCRLVNLMANLLTILVDNNLRQLRHLIVEHDYRLCDNDIYNLPMHIIDHLFQAYGQQLLTFKICGLDTLLKSLVFSKVCTSSSSSSSSRETTGLPNLRSLAITSVSNGRLETIDLSADLFIDNKTTTTTDTCFLPKLPKQLQSFTLQLTTGESIDLFVKFADQYRQQLISLAIATTGDYLPVEDLLANKLFATGLSQMSQLKQLDIYTVCYDYKPVEELSISLLATIGGSYGCTRLKTFRLINYRGYPWVGYIGVTVVTLGGCLKRRLYR